MKNLIDALKQNEVVVEFTKIDTGELRVMPCTLNSEIAGKDLHVKNITEGDTVVMWALDKKAWRDVRVSTIKQWYIK